MKVLVTGAAGYVGSLLCKELLDDGHIVAALDNLLYGILPLKYLVLNPNFHLVEGDIRDLGLLSRAIKGADAVIHLASIVGAEAAKISGEQAKIINTLCTSNIAELCSLFKVQKLIFPSSASVYGDQNTKLTGDPIATETSPLFPIEVYAESKVKSEYCIRSRCDVDYTILRFGTLFGLSPRMRFDLVVNLFTAKAFNHEDLELFGGDQSRPLLHVLDAVHAIKHALTKDIFGIYNVAHSNYTIVEVANIVKQILPCNFIIHRNTTDTRNYNISSRKITNSGFIPKFSVEDGVREIKLALEGKSFEDYKDPIYSNHASLFTDKNVMAKVYTEGAITYG